MDNRKIIYLDDAIDAVAKLYAIHGSEGSWVDQKDALKALEALSPAEPEQKKGEWMWERNPYSFTESYRCTRCGQKVLDDYWNYCPNCGADMRKKS